jgi:hypothetical protein
LLPFVPNAAKEEKEPKVTDATTIMKGCFQVAPYLRKSRLMFNLVAITIMITQRI